MKISFIATVYNEEDNILSFLKSLVLQTKLPDEIVIVDGGSRDDTLVILNSFKFPKTISVKILQKKGNRSVGRNEAIRKSSSDVLVCSDSGNVLDKNWIKNIIPPFKNKKVDIVAGYYKGFPKTLFQKCLIPYVLVMPGKVNPSKFLPATRSMAFRKKIWEEIGGFDEKLSHNEDYAFSIKIKKLGYKIEFVKNAIVFWLPRKNLKQAFVMFLRFSLGDAETGILRSNVLFLLARYFFGFYFVFLSILYRNLVVAIILMLMFILYIIWSVKKNYKYVDNLKAIIILPLLQFTADIAVLLGTFMGALKLITKFNYVSHIKQNKFLFFAVALYIFIMISTLKWGAPNQNHPFPYMMDEWHQLQAVRATFKFGTPNISGSANGTMLQFLLSGFFLAPFALIGLINPILIKINDSLMREHLFEILRLNTLIFGILSMVTLYEIAKRFMKGTEIIAVSLFALTPIWIMLGSYFKYDIALIFWIILSLFSFLIFYKNPTDRNYILAAIPSSLAAAVKISALPLLIAYIFSFFWFNSRKTKYKYFFTGIGLYIGIFILFGIPDTLFGKGNIIHYLFENIINAPRGTPNFNLGMNPYQYLFFHHYPIIFGRALLLLFVSCVPVWVFYLIKDGFNKSIRKYKLELFLFFSLVVFIFSLLPLNVDAGGNRSLVILPFAVLIIAATFKKLARARKIKILLISLVVAVLAVQLYDSFPWAYLKMSKSPQETSSGWIEKNIPINQTIGIENVPIYQMVPDVIQKEFYFSQYGVRPSNKYKYQVIDASSSKLPSIVLITNDDTEIKIFKKSPKKSLAERLGKEGYKKKIIFIPNLSYYKINETDYYFSGLTSIPFTISIYMK